MVKVYIEKINNIPLVPLLLATKNDISGKSDPYKNLPFQKQAILQLNKEYVEIVDNPQDSDYLLIPHMYKAVYKNTEYINRYNELSNEYRKKIIVFSFQDSTEPIFWPEAIILRASAYASTLLHNELMMPYIVEDFAARKNNLSYRGLPSAPVVGFVGWARFDTWLQLFRSFIREVINLSGYALKYGFVDIGTRRKGLFIRKEVMSFLDRSRYIKTNFIIRDKYGGTVRFLNTKTIEQMRSEYIQNMSSSDLVLCVRGDGNGSQRFYEALSIGRIPLLIDTDCALPLENKITYNRFVIRVPYRKRKYIDEYVREFFKDMTENEYKIRQREARDSFEQYLGTDAFYSYLFEHENIKHVQ